jgi:LCP family protein required for cell wall assembly
MSPDSPLLPTHPTPPRRRARLGPALLVLTAALLVAGLALHRSLTHPFGAADGATVLVFGVDAGLGSHPRSDTVLFGQIALRPTRQVAAVTLPRDTRVHLPDHKGFHKLNAAIALGGPDLARRTIEADFGLRAEHTVVIRCEGLVALVDALGGVMVDVPEDMDYDDHAQDLSIHLKQGRQRLDGHQAEGFVRFRHDGLGDVGRIQRQHAFLKALGHEAANPLLLLRLPAIWRAFGGLFVSDLSRWQLAGLAYSLRGLEPGQVQVSTLPGHPQTIGGVSYYVAERVKR